MILFGHEGPVLGAAWLGYRLTRNKNSFSALVKPVARMFKSGFDFRIALMGALLPDLIDKPLGHLIFREQIANGRIFAHTLLFFLLLFILGLWLYRRKQKSWLITLAMADLGHLILDDIWNAPATMFWPLLGWQFPWLEIELLQLVLSLLDILLRNPRIFFVELVGFLICLGFSIDLLKRKKIRLFILKGAIDE